MTADWSRKFDSPIPLPKGRQLVTLKDAGTHITKLAKSEHTAAEWQAAIEALILVATLGGPTMFARIGIMLALNRGYVREFTEITRGSCFYVARPPPNIANTLFYAADGRMRSIARRRGLRRLTPTSLIGGDTGIGASVTMTS
jgi:hypothetical protein